MIRFRVELTGRMLRQGEAAEPELVLGLVHALPDALDRLGRLESSVWVDHDLSGTSRPVELEPPDGLLVRLMVRSESDFQAERHATERVRLAVRSLVRVDPPLTVAWDGAYIERLPRSA